MTSSGGAGTVPGGWCSAVCRRSSDIISAELCASAVELTSLLERCDTPAVADTAVGLSHRLSECLTLSVCVLPPVIEASHKQWWCRRISVTSGVVSFVSLASLCRVCRRLSTTKRSTTGSCDVGSSCPRSAVKDKVKDVEFTKHQATSICHIIIDPHPHDDVVAIICAALLVRDWAAAAAAAAAAVLQMRTTTTRAPSHIRRTCVCTLINHCNSCSAVKR